MLVIGEIGAGGPGAVPTERDGLAVEGGTDLQVEDFEADLGSVVLPEGPLSEVDLSRAAGSFVDAFRER